MTNNEFLIEFLRKPVKKEGLRITNNGFRIEILRESVGVDRLRMTKPLSFIDSS